MTDGTEPRIALVTAASRGIGAACARRLAADGCRLALLARSDAVDELAGELDAVAVRGSTADPDDLARLVSTALERWGRIDVVVNNTGHAAKGELLGLSDAQWHEALDLLLLNVVRLSRLVVETMCARRSGAIVNISAFGAVEPSLEFPLSSCLRAGLSAFCRLFAERYGPLGVRMNNVLPGFVDSYPERPERCAAIPAGRYASVDEIADVVAYLASGGAAYVTGQNVRVDGGLTRSV